MARTDLHVGQIVIVSGGTFHGHGAEIKKIDREKGKVEALIAGKVRRLAIGRVEKGEGNDK